MGVTETAIEPGYGCISFHGMFLTVRRVIGPAGAVFAKSNLHNLT